MSNQITTSVIFENIKVFYTYQRQQPLESLNPIGNFYRSNHIHNDTQRFMENYLEAGHKPRVSEVIYSDTLGSPFTIIDILYDYQRTEGELFIKNIEDQIEKYKKK